MIKKLLLNHLSKYWNFRFYPTYKTVGSGLGFKYQIQSGFRSGAGFSNNCLEPKLDLIRQKKIIIITIYIALILNPNPIPNSLSLSLSHSRKYMLFLKLQLNTHVVFLRPIKN